MSQSLKIALVILLGLVGLYVSWVSYPPSRYKKEVALILEQRQQELQLRQKLYAADEAVNIYVDPTFRELWCLRSELASQGGSIRPGAVNRTVGEFIECSPLGQGLKLEEGDKALELAKKTRADLERARQSFLELLPQLKIALSKPVFLGPASTFDAGTELPNFIGLRRVAQALAFEASLEAAAGQSREAVNLCLVLISLGHSTSHSGNTLIGLMISIAVQSIGILPLAPVVAQAPLEPETLREVAAELGRNTLDRDSLGRTMECELLMFHNTMKAGSSLATGFTGQSQLTFSILDVAGIVSREIRLFDNDYYPMLKLMHELKPVDLSWLSQAGLASDLRGSHGLLAAMMIPNVSRATGQVRLARCKVQALQVAALARLFRATQGRYPASLDELKQVGVETIPANELSDAPFSLAIDDKGLVELRAPVDKIWEATLGLNADRAEPYLYRDGQLVLPLAP